MVGEDAAEAAAIAAADVDAQENAVVREDAQEDNAGVVFMVFAQKEWEIGAIKV